MIQDHANLTREQKEVLGFIHSINKTIETEIFEFEHLKWKDYEKLARKIVYLTNRRKSYSEDAENMDIPIENIKAFNKGIIKGLINPNRLTTVTYY